jgi:hypothetical protein
MPRESGAFGIIDLAVFTGSSAFADDDILGPQRDQFQAFNG